MENPNFTSESAVQNTFQTVEISGFFRILGLQVILVLLVAIISAAVAGKVGFWSAFAGGFVYVVPSAVTTLILAAGVRMQMLQSMSVFMLKAFRLGMAVLLMGVIGYAYRHQLVWPAFLIGLFVALKAMWILVLTKKL